MRLLSLSGGGSNGDWQAGICYALYEKGYKPDVIAGTSVGALNGIMLAIGEINSMMSVWMNLKEGDVRVKRKNIPIIGNHLLHKIGIAKPYTGLWSNSPLYKTVKKHILGKETKCDFYSSVVNVHTGKYFKFKIEKGEIFTEANVDDYASMIVASTAIPVYFDPVIHRDTMYVDGGVHHVSPIKMAIKDNKISKMTAVNCQPMNPLTDPKRPKDIMEMAGWTLTAILEKSFRSDWEEFHLVNNIVKNSKEKIIINGYQLKYIQSRIYAPEYDLGNAMKFNYKKARINFRNGYERIPTNYKETYDV